MTNSLPWTAPEAAYMLSEAYAASRGEEEADPNYTSLQTLAVALDANPEYLEEVWDAWCEEMEADGWAEKQLQEARFWLDMVVLDEMAAE